MEYFKKHWGNLLLVGAVAAYLGLSLGTQNCPMCVAGDFLGLNSSNRSASARIPIGDKPLAAWNIPLVNGEQVESAQLEGRVTVLAYWATWCVPCLKEIPDLVQLRNEFSADEVEIVGVSVDEPNANLERFVERYKMNYKVGRESESLHEAFGTVRSIPTIFILDKDGKVQYRHIGKMPHHVLQAQISELVATGEMVSGL